MFQDISKAQSLLIQFSGSQQVDRILGMWKEPFTQKLVPLLDQEMDLARSNFYPDEDKLVEVIYEVCIYLIGLLRGHENPYFVRNLYEEHIG